MGLFIKKQKSSKTNAWDLYVKQVEEFLLREEYIKEIRSLIVGFLALTDKRLIFMEKDMESQEAKTIIRSIPYSKINGVGLVKNEKISDMEDELILNTKAGTYNLKLKEDNTIIKYMHDIILQKIL